MSTNKVEKKTRTNSIHFDSFSLNALFLFIELKSGSRTLKILYKIYGFVVCREEMKRQNRVKMKPKTKNKKTKSRKINQRLIVAGHHTDHLNIQAAM